ncbi:FAD-dependent oxidoreductase [Tropicimonas marinistellae]|uniref:FAD-dependent oxidoreductase n=1 Tax=Tropicimonas marinistellae TaxID=1739787 RepID=UPI000831CB60|nr:GMC family oxidoreductase [Tropicimonas marinistellae]
MNAADGTLGWTTVAAVTSAHPATLSSLTDGASNFDVVIVGTGMGGSAVAFRLAGQGCRVLMLERGQPPLQVATAENNTFLYSAQPLGHEFRIVGGKSKYYGAALYRFRESDFKERAVENGISPAWPIRYDDLESYYCEAEEIYRVHGASTGDPTEPWRSRPYPHDRLPHDPLVARIAARLQANGVPTAAIPRGIDYGPGGSCVLCGQCDAHYCVRDAKMDADTATLRPALAAGNVKLLYGAECLKVLVDPSGRRAEGVLVRHDGQEKRILAGQVVVSAGFPHSALLLRRSRMSIHPEGVGNASGWLGRGVAAHSTGTLFPVVGLRPLGARHTKTFAINAWADAGPDWPHPLGVAQIAGQTPFWLLTSKAKRPLVRAIGERSLHVFHMGEALPTKETGWSFDGDELGNLTPPVHRPEAYGRLRHLVRACFRELGYPVIAPRRPVEFWHETGGAIMGADPETSVTDAQGRVHGVENLHVADATVLPSASSVNTGLTIVALSLRTADAVLEAAGAQAPAARHRLRSAPQDRATADIPC